MVDRFEFDWDGGNWPKCAKHGVSRGEIETLFGTGIVVKPDPNGSEERLRAIGRTGEGKYLFVVFTLRRRKDDATLIRPISARYMHRKEIRRYESG